MPCTSFDIGLEIPAMEGSQKRWRSCLQPFVDQGDAKRTRPSLYRHMHLRIDVGSAAREAAAVPWCDPYDAEDPFANNSGRRIVCHATATAIPSSLAAGDNQGADRRSATTANPQDCDFERRCYTVPSRTVSGSVNQQPGNANRQRRSGGGAGGDTGGSMRSFQWS